MKKQVSDQYTLTVTGADIFSWEQQNIEITGNITLDITVTRTMTGNDGTTYTTLKIGDQWWMAENLKETQYRNGDPIPEETDNATWEGLSTGARYAPYSGFLSPLTSGFCAVPCGPGTAGPGVFYLTHLKFRPRDCLTKPEIDSIQFLLIFMLNVFIM